MQKLLLVACLAGLSLSINAQRNIDVSHYYYVIRLSDQGDTISGTAIIFFTALQSADKVEFDLARPNAAGKGMTVKVVTAELNSEMAFTFTQEGDKLIIPLTLKKGEKYSLVISYSGIPADGLIISKNKFGKRTFFSDNWPNRAHNWIPCVDDPADKASVYFVVKAPQHYKVVSNGVLIKEENVDDYKVTEWEEDVPLPTKVMVIGAADFAVDTAGNANAIPVTSWVFSENKKDGFYDYAPAKDILSFFINYIGPYPYKKLANVQSKTIFGGMENAGAIFYFENSVTGKKNIESLLSHEIVHQWFGDMATEKSFPHLWLSEGFATYLTHIFIESKYGTDSLNEEMQKDRDDVIAFARQTKQPIVDTVSSFMKLLNPNSYKKGGWVLHMLRRQLGDGVFHQIIRDYYVTYAGKNADTRDFQRVCEKVSGKNLQTFFDQWLYTPGLPKLAISWTYDANSRNLLLTVDQTQDSPFVFPLEIQLQSASGKSQSQTLSISKKNEQFTIPVLEKPSNVYLDPHTSLLFETIRAAEK